MAGEARGLLTERGRDTVAVHERPLRFLVGEGLGNQAAASGEFLAKEE